jgi:hypothetical protein
MADATILATTAAALYTISSAGNASSGHAFDGLGEEWTRERLPDAHAYTRLSKSFSDVTLFKHHKNWGKLLMALPLAVPHMLSMMQFRGKSELPFLEHSLPTS